MKNYIIYILLATVVLANQASASEEEVERCMMEIEENLKKLTPPNSVLKLANAIPAYRIPKSQLKEKGLTTLSFYANQIKLSDEQREELPQKCLEFIESYHGAIKDAEHCPDPLPRNFIGGMRHREGLNQAAAIMSACISINI